MQPLGVLAAGEVMLKIRAVCCPARYGAIIAAPALPAGRRLRQ